MNRLNPHERGAAASFALVGLGTDTGNSFRGPASHLALFGIRSTLGPVSRDGIIPLYLDGDVATVLETGEYAPCVEGALESLTEHPGDIHPSKWKPPCPDFCDHEARKACRREVVAAVDSAGLQILARPFDEATLFRIASPCERATGHRRPPEGFPPLTDRVGQ